MSPTVVLTISRASGITASEHRCVDDALLTYDELVKQDDDLLEVKIARPDKGTMLVLMPGMSKEFVAEELSTQFVWADDDWLKIRPVLKPQYRKSKEPTGRADDQRLLATNLWGATKNWLRGA